jgi:hypothetical protein
MTDKRKTVFDELRNIVRALDPEAIETPYDALSDIRISTDSLKLLLVDISKCLMATRNDLCRIRYDRNIAYTIDE